MAADHDASLYGPQFLWGAAGTGKGTLAETGEDSGISRFFMHAALCLQRPARLQGLQQRHLLQSTRLPCARETR